MSYRLSFFLFLSILVSISIISQCQAQNFESSMLSYKNLPYGSPPYFYEGSKNIMISIKTEPKIIRELVPEPLKIDTDSTLNIVIAVHNMKGYSTYKEACFTIAVSYNGNKGWYIPVLFLDKIMPILAGREIYGFSKVGAEISFEEKGGKFHANIERAGTNIMDLTLSAGKPVIPIPGLPAREGYFNYKIIPSVKEGAPPDADQLTYTKFDNFKMTELRIGKADIKFNSTDSFPLKKIPVTDIASAIYFECDFTLNYGEVVYDYLYESNIE
jgi:acetoacetate decarboxylase